MLEDSLPPRLKAAHAFVPARAFTRLCALLAGLTCAACDLLLQFDQPQCHSDADCNGRGLADATCVGNLCIASQSRRDGESASPAQAEREATRDGGDVQTQQTPKAASTPTASEAASSAASGAAGSGSRPQRQHPPPTAAAAGFSTSSGGAGQAGAGSADCTGASCPECQLDADCEKRGLLGAVCTDSVCYAQKPQCAQDADCLALGPEYEGGRCAMSKCLPNPRWRCEPPPPPTTAVDRPVSLPILDGLSRATLADVHVLLCPKLDLTCAGPVAETRSDKQGTLRLTIPANFSGYIQQTEARGYLPAMYFVPNIIPDDGVLDGFPLVGSGIAADALASSLGTTLDKDRGHLMVIAKDCNNEPVDGVTFSSPQQDKSTVVFYVYDQLPSTSAHSTADVGQGGFLNMPAGTPMIELRQADSGLLLSQVSVVVRAGFISVAFVPPLSR